MTTKKTINYLGRDFSALRGNLIEFVKQYFPDTYKDFEDASPGMMFIELAAYVGDVLGFYLDENFKELYLDTAVQRKNIINGARLFNYKPVAAISSTTIGEAFVIVPASGSAGSKVPDPRYSPIISTGLRITSKTSPKVTFETQEDINFSVMGSNLNESKVESIVYSIDGAGIPTQFLLKKLVKVVSGETKSFTQIISSPQKYTKIQLPSRNISEVVSVTDSNDNSWYQVDSLAQDTIFVEQRNTPEADPELGLYSGSVPYLLKLKKVPKRYERVIDDDNLTYLIFGAGTLNSNDEELVPNPGNVGTPFANNDNKYDYAIDPENFLKTKTFGEAPGNTTLTISYREGGGPNTNIPSKALTEVGNAAFTFTVNTNLLNSKTLAGVKNSIGFSNPDGAMGGRLEEPSAQIKFNAKANFAAQKRCVTAADYIVRSYSLPSKFGAIAKVHAERSDQVRVYNQNDMRTNEGTIIVPADPLAINLYVLSYDVNKNLTTAQLALKENIKTYLSQYRMLTDTVNIMDGTVINFQVFFEIVAQEKENKNIVLMRCIDALKDFFNIDNISFNQPIKYDDIFAVLRKVEGVQTPVSVDIKNKAGGNYSNNYVDIAALTKKQIIHPPRTVAIFELKFPDSDIIGSCI